MERTKYIWETSRDAFRTLKTIHLFGEADIKKLSFVLKLDKTTLLRHIYAFSDRGIIKERRQDRKKFYCIDYDKLKKMVGVSNDKKLSFGINASANFKELKEFTPALKDSDLKTDVNKIVLDKERIDNFLTDFGTKTMVIFYNKEIQPLLNEIEKLKKENALLKAKK